MKGRILSYSVQTNSGEISGDDGNRYSFTGQDWQESFLPVRGTYVDFAVTENQATSVFRALEGSVPAGATGQPGGNLSTYGPVAGAKNRTTAGLFALLLGTVGAHKFYLGHTGLGILFLAGLLLCGVGLIATIPISLIEGIIYLTKSDAEFEEVYVKGRKAFF